MVESLTKGEVFHLLQNPRRRAVMRYLIAHSDQEAFKMADIAEAVAAWEHDTTIQRLDSAHRQRVYISLYQAHLPKLADHGVIEYGQRRGTIRPTPLLDVLSMFLGDDLHDADTDLHIEENESETSRLPQSVKRLFTR